jgi:hypothetical protein
VLIAGMGDSIAAGDGNPDRPRHVGVVWRAGARRA